MPAYLATLILGRDVALAIAAIYYRYASLPAPKTFRRYWDFSLPSAEVHPTTVSKYNTFLQLLLIGATLALPVALSEKTPSTLMSNLNISPDTLHSSMNYFQYLVAGTTAWSGLSYAYLKNAVTILGTNEELKAKQGARGRAIIGVLYGSVVFAATWLFFTRKASAEALPNDIIVDGDRDDSESENDFAWHEEARRASNGRSPEMSEVMRPLLDCQTQLLLLENQARRRLMARPDNAMAEDFRTGHRARAREALGESHSEGENRRHVPTGDLTASRQSTVEVDATPVLDQRGGPQDVAELEAAARERTETQQTGKTPDGQVPARTGVTWPVEGV